MVDGRRKQNSDGSSSSSPGSSCPTSTSGSCQGLPVYGTEGQGQVASSDRDLAEGIEPDVEEPKSGILGRGLNRYVCRAYNTQPWGGLVLLEIMSQIKETVKILTESIKYMPNIEKKIIYRRPNYFLYLQ